MSYQAMVQAKRDAAARRLAKLCTERTPRGRQVAHRDLRRLLEGLAFGEVKLTYSLVSKRGEGIIYRRDGEHPLGLYDRSGEAWDRNLRGECYWDGLAEILAWYKAIKKRHNRSNDECDD